MSIPHRHSRVDSPVHIEPLESRQLFAAGGPVTPPLLTPVPRVKLILQGTSVKDNIAIDVKKGYLHFFLNGVTKRYNAARVGAIQIHAGNGSDVVRVGNGAPGVYIDGGGHNDNIAGGLGNDTILGSGGNDIINGGMGTDLIDGGKGQDTLMGGGDRDTLKANDLELDVVNGGDEFDTAALDLQDLFDGVERRQYP
ncbi:MAG: hypothetical protein H7Z14_09570 [Anaerolineae bacterium]|nr:hypothetical protein [Phycisphaerae bacterium]